MPLTPRLILIHKQKTSARVRFLRLPEGILAFSPLPELAALRDEDFDAKVQVHPAAFIREAETRLGLPENSIAAEAEFQAWVDTPVGDVPILLAYFTTIDPPFAAAEGVGGKFIAMTEALSLAEIERNLLRRVYEYVIG
jgi:hypothetical protein